MAFLKKKDMDGGRYDSDNWTWIFLKKIIGLGPGSPVPGHESVHSSQACSGCRFALTVSMRT